MDIHGIEATRNRGSRKISAVRQRILEGCTRWAYALPTPRTRVKLALLPVGLEVSTSQCVCICAHVYVHGHPCTTMVSKTNTLQACSGEETAIMCVCVCGL